MPQPAKRWPVVILLLFGVLVNYIDRGNLSVAAVPVMREFHLQHSAMGTLLSAFFWTYAILQVPAGYLVDRFGIKWTYAGGFLLWSLTSAAVGVAHSFNHLLALRLLLGVGEAVAAPASLAYIRRNFSAEAQGLPTAVYGAGMMLGPGIGSFFGAQLLEHIGWRELFVLTGLGGCVWLLPWMAWVPGHGAADRAAVSRDVPAATPWGLLSMRVFWGITFGAFFYSYYWVFFLTWLPTYLISSRGLSSAAMGTFMAVPLLAMALTATISARVADRLVARYRRPVLVRRCFVCAGSVMASSFLLVLPVRSETGLLTVLCVSMLGLGIASSSYWTLLQALSPSGIIGRAIGYQNMIGNFAGICAPLATGFLVGGSKDFQSSVWVAGSTLWIAALIYGLLIREDDAAAVGTLCARRGATRVLNPIEGHRG